MFSKAQHPFPTSFMVYRGYLGSSYPWVKYDNLPQHLLAAILKLEDPWFFRHSGTDIGRMIARIATQIQRRQDIGSVSTITMQLIKNLYFTPERRVTRKLQEMGLAVLLDRKLTKEQQLEIYVNVIEWGSGIWGIESAAAHYFAKCPHDLTLFEVCVLAAMIPAPRAALCGRNLLRLSSQVNVALTSLFLSGLITADECSEGLTQNQLLADRLPRSEDLSSSSNRTLQDQVIASPASLANIRQIGDISPVEGLSLHCVGLGQFEMTIARLDKEYGQTARKLFMLTGNPQLLRESAKHIMHSHLR